MNSKALFAALLLVLPLARAGAQAFSREDDTRVKPPQAYAANPDKLDVEGGFSYMEGNVNSRGINGAYTFHTSLSSSTEIMSDGSANYSTFGDQTTMEKLRASLLFAYHLQPHWNIYAASTQAHNRFLNINYRTTNGVGICAHSFMPGPFKLFLVSLAAAPEYAYYSDRTIERTTRAVARLNFALPATEYLDVGFDGFYLPSLQDFGNYQLYAEGFAEFRISPKALSYKVTLSDEYDSASRPGIKLNDFSATQAIVVHCL
jgi:hypothetical protein